MLEKVNEILSFWFGKDPARPLENQKNWWQKDEHFDQEIKRKFGDLLELAIEGKLTLWQEAPKSCLAYIILLDQFSRNIYRGTPKSFSQDSLALTACQKGIEHKLDRDLDLIHRQFFYMPLEHSEELLVQQESVAQFKHLYLLSKEHSIQYQTALKGALGFAIRHLEIIEAFGRFPHRNAILSRQSTAQEISFLNQPNSSF